MIVLIALQEVNVILAFRMLETTLCDFSKLHGSVAFEDLQTTSSSPHTDLHEVCSSTVAYSKEMIFLAKQVCEACMWGCLEQRA